MFADAFDSGQGAEVALSSVTKRPRFEENAYFIKICELFCVFSKPLTFQQSAEFFHIGPRSGTVQIAQ
jgi:hypothetical protein